MCKVKVRSKVTIKFSHFGVPGQLDGLQRDNIRPKCLVNVHEGYCMRMKGILKKFKVKVRSQKVTINLVTKCRATHIFWVMLHADIDGNSHLTL